MIRSIEGVVIGIAASVVFAACDGSQVGSTEKGAALGTALGAGLGAIVGHETGNTGAGIAIGAASGLLAGGLIGKTDDDAHRAMDLKDRQIERQQRLIDENRRILEELRSRGADVRSSKRGVVVNLPDVLFDFDRSSLRPDARRTVKEIADVIKKAGGRRVAVEGHTDSVGTIAYNQKLSEDRARSVASELVADGISRRRISTRGFGESDPIASNKTEAGRQRNRRVEIIIENRRY